MEISLSSELLQGLPGPDDSGLVRVSVALKVRSDGKKAKIVEINDVPMGESSQKDEMDEFAASVPSAQSVSRGLEF